MTRTLDVLNHLIEITELRLLNRLDHLQNLAVHEASIIEAMRVIVIVESALCRLIDERDLLAASEPTV